MKKIALLALLIILFGLFIEVSAHNLQDSTSRIHPRIVKAKS